MNEPNLNYLLTNISTLNQFADLMLEKHPWAEDYIYYYVHVMYALHESLPSILESIPERDHGSFTYEKAYNYLRAYERKRLSLAVVIPTCDRPEAINFLLGCAAVLYRRYGMDIIIYDSSDDDKTEKVCKKMRSYGYFNVIYKKYTGTFDGFSLDHKIMQAYLDYGDQYDYLWLCRDGLVPIVDEIIDKLRHHAKEHVDCFIVDTKARIANMDIEKKYSTLADCNNLLREQACRLQTLGMLIFSGRFAKELVKSEPLCEANYSLWQMAAPFHAFAKKPFDIVFMTKNVFAANNAACGTHFWSKASKMLEQWAYRWCKVITNMPSVYSEAKKECLMVYTVDFHPFTSRSVMEMRAWGGMTHPMVKKYREYIEQVTETPYWFFSVVSATPKWILRTILNLATKHPSFVRRVRQKFIPDHKEN